jgi:hypothetical protein
MAGLVDLAAADLLARVLAIRDIGIEEGNQLHHLMKTVLDAHASVCTARKRSSSSSSLAAATTNRGGGGRGSGGGDVLGEQQDGFVLVEAEEASASGGGVAAASAAGPHSSVRSFASDAYCWWPTNKSRGMLKDATPPSALFRV